MAKKILTSERLKQVASYDPVTGKFVRSKFTQGRFGGIGRLMGGPDKEGYRIIAIDGVKYFEHRLAWLYVFGVWPEHQIDHINGMKDDNRIVNLRDVTKQVNQQNIKKANIRNKCGFLGVSQRAGKFVASIRDGTRQVYLGCFDTAQEAHLVYLAKKETIHAGYVA